MTGQFVNMDEGDDTDIRALDEGYASVVPVKFDLTDMQVKHWLSGEWAL
jgi:5'-nucleotidase